MTPQEIDHVADSDKKVEQTDESAQNVQNEDLIQRKAAIEAIDEYERLSAVSQTIRNMTSLREIVQRLPSAQPETTSVTVGRTKGETTLWYECDHCGMPVTTGDCFCANCGRKLVWKI